jgi:hypothetical protein
MNYQNGFDVPIMAILCDGKHFYFFQFVDRRQANTSPQLFLGEFADGDQRVSIDDIELNPSKDFHAFVRQIRNTCDSLYYVFLSAYQSGLEAYWNRSMEKGKAQGKGRESTPGWHRAKVLAREALEEAKSAWNQYHDGKLVESKTSAERAVQKLAERYMCCFPSPVVVDANYGFLSAALKKPLSRGPDFCPIIQKIWRICEVSKAWTASLILLIDSMSIQEVLLKDR